MTFRGLLVFVLSLNLLQGCQKVGPDFEPPCYINQDKWIETEHPNIEADTHSTLYWWEHFDDKTLNHLVAAAYRQNFSLQIACHRIQEARARLGIAIGNFYPQQQEAIGSAYRTKLSENQANIGPNPDLYFKEYQIGSRISWELDFWGKYRRAIESERAELCASLANYDDIKVLLLSDVASTYITIRTLQEQYQVVEKNIAIQQRGLEISEAQNRGGFVSKLDVEQATTLLHSSKARLPEIRKNIRQAQNALAILLGTTPKDVTRIISSEGTIPQLPKSIHVTAPETLLYRRPDIRESLYATAAQSARIGIAYSDFFPQLSLTGSISLRSSGNSTMNVSGQSGNLLDRKSLTFNYGTDFVWPILNYGRIANRVKEEQERFSQLVLNYQEKILTAYKEVEDGMIAFVSAQEQVDQLRASAEAARRGVKLANTQYIEGLVNYTRVLNTQEALLNEEERLILAKGEIAQGFIATYKAMGGGWEPQFEEMIYEASPIETVEEEEVSFIETPLEREPEKYIPPHLRW